MRVIIVGSGRVGAGLASQLAEEGHEVVILDTSTNSFRRLAPGFSGQALRGDGTDTSVLERAGAREAEWFFAMTNGDNRNILAAQLARQTFGIPHVLCKINDPVRSRAYATLGIDTVNRTEMMLDSIGRYMGRPAVPGATDVNVATVPAAPSEEPQAEAEDAVARAATAAVSERARTLTPISPEAADAARADTSGGR
jgi:trk system potassium uptake protein TrkA